METRPELLAPAGDMDCVRAAIENGADAVYFGLASGFNARARATNFLPSQLDALMQLLHKRSVKGYVTLNTLVFPSELPEAESLIRTIAESGVDAVLVQDVGVARLARAICPQLGIHASTQMTLTSAETIALAEDLGMDRVVLARELSLDEIKAIRQRTKMPIEVFVHGALCVAYSGQCLTSESLGGRSANRGQCAQACRLSFELMADGQLRDLKDQQYLLSPQDLAAYDLTEELIQAGVCSFKIEGRLKTPEYVANITRHYRQAIDNALSGISTSMDESKKYDMEMSFSRGFSPGWLKGCDHKMLVPATNSAKRGVLAGTVIGISAKRVTVRLQCPMSAGDGVVFEGNRMKNEEQGGRVFGVFARGKPVRNPQEKDVVELSFAANALDLSRITPGLRMWKTDDPKLNKRLRQSFEVADPVKRVPLDVTVECRAGHALKVSAQAGNGAKCIVQTSDILEAARKHPSSAEMLQRQLGRLGSTVYEIRSFQVEIDGSPMVPLSVLGQVRRELVHRLETSIPRSVRQLASEPALPILRGEMQRSDSRPEASHKPILHILCRNLVQLRAACEYGTKHLYVEFADIREYGEAVRIAKEHQADILVATPRIQKPNEMGIFHTLMKNVSGSVAANGILVRNFAALKFFREQQIPVVSDFSLNVANELSAEYFMQQGVQRVTASYDLNRDQLFDLVTHAPSHWLECVIHQHMPMFHMEHCVFCAVMSPGTNKTNCGRPCDFHQVELRDRIGKEHPLTADVGCRNTLYNATPQSAAEIVGDLTERGVGHFRVELLRENEDQTHSTIQLYSDLLKGVSTAEHVWNVLKAANRVGVTRGTLEGSNPLAII